MLTAIALLAAATEPTAADHGMNAVPIDHATVAPADIRIPVSAAIRASTWDSFIVKPSAPRHVRVACIVIAEFGVPGACIPASYIKPGEKTVDWAAARDAYERDYPSGDPAEAALYFAASERMNAARVMPRPGNKGIFAIRIFEETISPTDARPAFVPGPSLGTRQVTMIRPPDAQLMGMLYPAVALRHAVEARVSLICRIDADFSLLCRDPGQITLMPADVGDRAEGLVRDFRVSTYQLASTMLIGPTTIDGRDTTGQDLRITVVWKLP